jgi:hypothetical protein
MVDVPNIPAKNFGFYPNPVNTFITLNSPESISSVSIYNIMGQKLVNIVAADSDSRIDVSSLSEGVYFLEVNMHGRKDTYKFIKN